MSGVRARARAQRPKGAEPGLVHQWKLASPNPLIEWGGEVIATGIVGQSEMLRLRIGPR
ncbi:MAG TPA: hypothetical protein VFQ38_13755 [Longimicrobiales bacterium]|nr:hypothetical protein [Longimicrobiales bacterium]